MEIHFASYCVKKMEFYFQSNSVMNSLKCPKAKSLSHCLTELFPIYQNNIWTIRQWDNHTIVPPYYIEDCRISRPEVIFRKNDDNKPLRSFFSKDYFTQKSDRNLLHFCCWHRKYFWLYLYWSKDILIGQKLLFSNEPNNVCKVTKINCSRKELTENVIKKSANILNFMHN